jgi:sialate O-acetylesterase
MSRLRRVCFGVAGLLGLQTLPLQAGVTLGTPFRDGMVLQRGKPVAVWGWASPGEKVRVEFKGQAKPTTTDSGGRWEVKLDSLPASSEPAQLTVTGRNRVSVQGVLVGEVWLCSGQSNMNLPLSAARDAAHEIAAADHPLIRYFEVESVVFDQPLEMAAGTWKVCAPETAGRFTAVGYFFARELQRELGVPIGIIKSTLGGSPIEGWMSAEALGANHAAARAEAEEWKPLEADFQQRAEDYRQRLADWKSREVKARAAGQGFIDPQPVMAQERTDRKKPAGLYNGFIRPLEPLTLAGFLWYQGEGNSDAPADYRVLFPAMIRQWRANFQQEDLPFLFVQLPLYSVPNDPSGQRWAWFREVQTTVLSLPNVHMAVAIDVGEPGDIHPANKQDVGRRLALVALRNIYGRSVEDSGPVFSGMVRQGSAARVHLAHATGLNSTGNLTNSFTLAGSDKKFVPAQARIDGETVIVSAPGLAEPVAVRFNWSNCPEGFLFNASGLPAAPFRSDRW